VKFLPDFVNTQAVPFLAQNPADASEYRKNAGLVSRHYSLDDRLYGFLIVCHCKIALASRFCIIFELLDIKKYRDLKSRLEVTHPANLCTVCAT